MFAGRNFNDNAVHTAISRQFNIRNHTARKTKDLGAQVAFDDFSNGRLVIGGYRRHAGFDAVNTDFGKLFGDLDFIVFFQNDSGLLLPVTQGNVMNFDGFGRFKTFGDFL